MPRGTDLGQVETQVGLGGEERVFERGQESRERRPRKRVVVQRVQLSEQPRVQRFEHAVYFRGVRVQVTQRRDQTRQALERHEAARGVQRKTFIFFFFSTFAYASRFRPGDVLADVTSTRTPYTRGCGRSPARAHDAGTSWSRENATATARRVSSNGKKCGWSRKRGRPKRARPSAGASRAATRAVEVSLATESMRRRARLPRRQPPRRAPGANAGSPRRRRERTGRAPPRSQRSGFSASRTASASAVLRAANAACHASSCRPLSGASSRRNNRSSARRGRAVGSSPMNPGSSRGSATAVRRVLASASSSAKDATRPLVEVVGASREMRQRRGERRAFQSRLRRRPPAVARSIRRSAFFHALGLACLAARAGSRPGSDRGTPLEAGGPRGARAPRRATRAARR